MSRINRTPEQIETLQTGEFFPAVLLEMALQDGHWGPALESTHSWNRWVDILEEEYAEGLNDARLIAAALRDDPDTDVAPRLRALRLELVQVAAVAAQIAAVIEEQMKALENRQ